MLCTGAGALLLHVDPSVGGQYGFSSRLKVGIYTAHNFGGRNVPNAMDSQADSELKKYKSVSD